MSGQSRRQQSYYRAGQDSDFLLPISRPVPLYVSTQVQLQSQGQQPQPQQRYPQPQRSARVQSPSRAIVPLTYQPPTLGSTSVSPFEEGSSSSSSSSSSSFSSSASSASSTLTPAVLSNPTQGGLTVITSAQLISLYQHTTKNTLDIFSGRLRILHFRQIASIEFSTIGDFRNIQLLQCFTNEKVNIKLSKIVDNDVGVYCEIDINLESASLHNLNLQEESSSKIKSRLFCTMSPATSILLQTELSQLKQSLEPSCLVQG